MCNSLIHSRDHWKPYHGGLVFEEPDSRLLFPADSARVEMDPGPVGPYSTLRRFIIEPGKGEYRLVVVAGDEDHNLSDCIATASELERGVVMFGDWYHRVLACELLDRVKDELARYGYRLDPSDPRLLPES